MKLTTVNDKKQGPKGEAGESRLHPRHGQTGNHPQLLITASALALRFTVCPKAAPPRTERLKDSAAILDLFFLRCPGVVPIVADSSSTDEVMRQVPA